MKINPIYFTVFSKNQVSLSTNSRYPTLGRFHVSVHVSTSHAVIGYSAE